MNQLTSRINGLKRVSHDTSFGTRLMIADGIVMSKLTYLITLWGGAQQYLLNALQVQQLSAARVVLGFGCWGWRRSRLLKKVGWLSVKQLVFFHTVMQAHNTRPSPLGSAPVPVQQLSLQNQRSSNWLNQKW